jgi:hypothetical protein
VALRRQRVPFIAIAARCLRPVVGLGLAAPLAAAVLVWVPGRFAQLAVGGTVALLGYLSVVHPMRHIARSVRVAL